MKNLFIPLFTTISILHTFIFLSGQLIPQLVNFKGEPFSVLSYNIWNGFDWGKDTLRHEKTVAWVKSQNPDVVAFQELCGYTDEKLKGDAKSWGHPYSILLKTDGYPVGLTSRKPIQLKEKAREGLWHGMLHCETFGIDFSLFTCPPPMLIFD